MTASQPERISTLGIASRHCFANELIGNVIRSAERDVPRLEGAISCDRSCRRRGGLAPHLRSGSGGHESADNHQRVRQVQYSRLHGTPFLPKDFPDEGYTIDTLILSACQGGDDRNLKESRPKGEIWRLWSRKTAGGPVSGHPGGTPEVRYLRSGAPLGHSRQAAFAVSGDVAEDVQIGGDGGAAGPDEHLDSQDNGARGR